MGKIRSFACLLMGKVATLRSWWWRQFWFVREPEWYVIASWNVKVIQVARRTTVKDKSEHAKVSILAEQVHQRFFWPAVIKWKCVVKFRGIEYEYSGQDGNSATANLVSRNMDAQGSLVSRSTDQQGNTKLEINLSPSRTEFRFWPFLPPLRIRMDHLGRHVTLESVEHIEHIRRQATAQIVADALKSIGNERKKTKKTETYVEITNIANLVSTPESKSNWNRTSYLDCKATTSSYCICPTCEYKRSRLVPARTLILLATAYAFILSILQRIIQPNRSIQQQTVAQVLGVCLVIVFNLFAVLLFVTQYFKTRFCNNLLNRLNHTNSIYQKSAAEKNNESCEISFENVRWLQHLAASIGALTVVRHIYLILCLSTIRIFLDPFDWNTLPIFNWSWNWEITLTEFLVAQIDGFLIGLIAVFTYYWYHLYFRSVIIRKFFVNSHSQLTDLSNR